jgi:hypothetical protein
MRSFTMIFWMIPISLPCIFFLFLCFDRYAIRKVPVKGSMDGVFWGAVISNLIFWIYAYVYFRQSLGAAAANLMLLVILGLGLFIGLLVAVSAHDRRKYK